MPFEAPCGHVYSLDGVRVSFTVNPKRRDDFERFLAFNMRVFAYPVCLSDFKYKYLYTLSYQSAEGVHKMSLGYIFNGARLHDDVCKGFLDFNPNKVCHDNEFWSDFLFIHSCCDSWDVVRCDIAVDVPAARECVFLCKDGRKYSLDAYSFANRTEYLGQRSHLGYVKVYNKTIESGLDYPLSRIEVTCEPSLESLSAFFPRVYVIPAADPLSDEYFGLNDTDRFIVQSTLERLARGDVDGMMLFNSLGRKKREKLRPFILAESSLVSLSYDVARSLFKYVQCFVDGSIAPLKGLCQ